MASIQKRPNGKWRARYRDAAGHEHAKHFARKVDAQRWLDRETADMLEGRWVDPRGGRETFSSWFATWSARQVWARGTRQSAEQAAASVTFGDVSLRALRRSHVESWVKGMSATLAPTTCRTRYNYVHMCLAAAVRDRIIPVDPSDGVKLPRARRAEAAMVIPTPDQVSAALASAPDHFSAFVAVCAFAGLRLGEAAALTVESVDFLRRTIRVERQVQGERRSNVEVVSPKFGSERTVYVPEGLTELLAAHLEQFGPWGEEQWIFGVGHLLHRQTAGHFWRKTRTEAGLGDDFTLHSLRHFFASGLIAQGVDVVAVQRALGHSSPSITLSTYAHLWPDAEDRTRTAAAAVMASVVAPADPVRTTDSQRGADLR